jgi:hypothetical protein
MQIAIKRRDVWLVKMMRLMFPIGPIAQHYITSLPCLLKRRNQTLNYTWHLREKSEKALLSIQPNPDFHFDGGVFHIGPSLILI